MTSSDDKAVAAERIHGTGEMADRIRDCDWSRTPLGAVVDWPESLLVIVNMMLNAPTPMQVWWGEELVLLYNDGLRPILSDKHPECLGHSAPRVWAEAWALVEAQVSQVMNQAVPVSMQALLVPTLQNGVLANTYFDYDYSPVQAADGKVLALLCIARDVTSSLMNRQQVQQILSGTTDGMMLINRDWAFEFFNEQARLIGQIHRDVTGQNLWQTFPGLDYPDSPYLYHYQRAMYEAVEGDFVADYGEPLNSTLRIFVKPVETGILVIFRDVTAEKQAQAAMLQSEKLAAVGKLAGSIAHEINNPLESVTNLLYLAKHGEPADIQTYISLAERELRRVSVIANQTLRFYRQSTRPTQVTCNELFGSVLSVYQGRLVNSHIEVLERKRAFEAFECFEGEIRQVLSNLVGNAIDAMPGAGGKLLLRSRTAQDWKTGRRGIVLTVADTGSGMSAETQRKLFEAFYTTKGIGGTGLGLWVSQEIVGRHEGWLRVKSSQGAAGDGKHHGTVFTLFLPFDAVIRPGNPAIAG